MTQQNDLFITPGMRLVPSRLDSPAARAMLLAIAMQESRFLHRRQIPVPIARGFWQFETIGVEGVLTHHASRSMAEQACALMRYPAEVPAVYAAIEHNDALACAFARLLLWRIPEPLPGSEDSEEGWRQYLATWRPGSPHAHTWGDFYREAWETVT